MTGDALPAHNARANPARAGMTSPSSTDLQAAVDTARGFRVSSLSLGLDRLGASGSPALVVAIGFALVGVIALADYLTGYEVRLATLNLLPIAAVTWLAGRRWGLAASALAAGLWLFAFSGSHYYSHELYFYWEGAALVTTFVVVVLLLAKLRVALERSDERFLHALEGLPAAVCVTARDSGRMLLSNRRYDELSSSGEPLARRVGAGNPGSAAGYEARDPSTGQWYLVETVALRWLDGTAAALTAFTDVTESKLAQTLREQHAAAVDRAARAMALGEVASALAHELNQPLAAIAAYNEACLALLAAPKWDPAEVVEAMERCRRQAVRAGDIVRRMREFVRRREPLRAARNVNDVVRSALQLAQPHLDGTAVELELAETLPAALADGFMIEQVLLNLLRNAVEAMHGIEPGGRRITLRTAAARAARVEISVRDRGPGLDPAVADRLYEPFFTTKPDGLGLGLSLCRSIVEAHGGELSHAAAEGGGMLFRFTLPAERS